MTKFEEEVKRPANGPLTELNNNMQEVFSQYRKMRQYADYLEYDSKQKDERILKLENENSFMRDERTTFDSNGMAIEPIIPHQPLPVVPEDVAKWIEELKSKGYGPLKNPGTYGEAISDLSDESLDKILTWISQHQEEFMRAWLDGYTVEKPQLFYLCEKNTGYYLRKTGNDWYGITPHYSNDYDENYMNYKFTQQEIDSMETGSYEQIEVEK